MKKALSIGLLLTGILVFVIGLAVAGYAAKEPSYAAEENDNSDVSYRAPSGDVYMVVVENGRFMPVDLEVKAGDTVQWVNLDDVDHTVTFESCAIDRELPAGSTVRYTFTQADGTLYYGSLLNPKAQGSVTVN